MATKLLRLIIVLVFLGISTLSAQTALIDSLFHLPSLVDSISTYSMDYKGTPGTLQLAAGEKENLAKGKYAYLVYLGASPTDTGYRNALRVLDGSYSSPSYISFPPPSQGGLEGSYLMIDLKAVRTIKKVQILTLGGGSGNAHLRVRAFTLYAGVDTITMDKVYQEPDNQLASPVVSFPEINARFVKMVVDVLASNNAAVVSEVEVFGAGYLPQGEFVSSVRNLGKKVNFSTVEYQGANPPRTAIAFSFRTGPTLIPDTAWSDWSPYVAGKSDLFDVFEPRQFLQYKIKMNTDTLTTPSLKKVFIYYDTLAVASQAKASISPQKAQILREQEFTINVNTSFIPQDLGIDSIFIVTPSPAQLLGVTVNDNPVSYTPKVTFTDMKIALGATVKSNATIKVRFKETPFLDNKAHTVYLSSKQLTRNPQRADVDISDKIAGWSVITVGVPEKLLNETVVSPNPFSPNGDGVNDVANVQFFLGNIAEPSQLISKEIRQLTVKVYDLSGRLIQELYSGPVNASAFVASNAVKWNGMDHTGKYVRPGVYIIQVAVESDNGGEQTAKTVVVSY